MKKQKKWEPATLGGEFRQMQALQRSGARDFRLPISPLRLENALRLYYTRQVVSRGGTCRLEGFTGQIIARVARLLSSLDDTQSEKLAAAPRSFGIAFLGNVGNGKTTLMRAIDNVYHGAAAIRLVDPYMLGHEYQNDFGIRIVKAREIAEWVRTDPARYRAAVDDPALGIDDLGTEPKEVIDYGRVLTPMIDLLMERYDRQLFTMITSNLNPDKIKEHYGDERISDRLREIFEVVTFGDAESFR